MISNNTKSRERLILLPVVNVWLAGSGLKNVYATRFDEASATAGADNGLAETTGVGEAITVGVAGGSVLATPDVPADWTAC